MQLDKLTLKSQEALQETQRLARGHSHQEVDGEHLLQHITFLLYLVMAVGF